MTDTSQWQTILDDWRIRSHAPCIAVAVRVDGELSWAGSSSEVQLPNPARFCIYSITKTLTAICVLRLQELGILSITSAMAHWLPDLALPASITLEHLLRHTSGLGDYGSLSEYHAAVRSDPEHPWSDAQFLDAVLPRGPLFATGEGWAYSNIGYMLLRLVLQNVTGLSFRECVDEFIVSPLGLRDTFVAEEIADWASCVPGYGTEVTSDGHLVDIRSVYHPRWCAPGVAVSTAEETTLIFDALFAGRLLHADTLARMLTIIRVPGDHPPAVTPSYGMGIMGDPDSLLGPSYGHGGGGPGYLLSVTMLPNSPLGRLVLATFINTSNGPGVQEAETELLQRLLDDNP